MRVERESAAQLLWERAGQLLVTAVLYPSRLELRMLETVELFILALETLLVGEEDRYTPLWAQATVEPGEAYFSSQDYLRSRQEEV